MAPVFNFSPGYGVGFIKIGCAFIEHDYTGAFCMSNDEFDDDFEQDFEDDFEENQDEEVELEDDFEEEAGFEDDTDAGFEDEEEESSGGDEFDKPVSEGDTVELEIDDLGSKGDGIARVEGFVVFVPGGEVGESYDVEITSVGRKFAFGEIVD